jgi:SAM-dependent methyltransferase
MIAASGAEVSGCDRVEDAVARAQVHESATPHGISYRVADMTATGYDDGAFDLVFHVGSLIASARDEIVRTLAETRRILASRGALVLSVTHPSLYLEGSVSRSREPAWIRHAPLEPGLPYGHSQRFHERYYDVDGNDDQTVVWHHPLAYYVEAVLGTGFRIERVQEPIVSPQHLVAAHWGARHGYPAVFQLRAEKI